MPGIFFGLKFQAHAFFGSPGVTLSIKNLPVHIYYVIFETRVKRSTVGVK